jgi:anti-sigma regulatory factor (Ser/Thr protein kinase)
MPRHDVRDFVDVLHVQAMTKRFAATLGFSGRECSELAIVASELSSNILKYGPPGSLELVVIDDAGGSGLGLIAHDVGPPFRSLELALQDGWDDTGPIDPILIFRRKGMGGGLGAVSRLTHRVSVEPEPGGKRILAVRYVKPQR